MLTQKKSNPTQKEIHGQRRHSQPNSTVNRFIPIIVRPHHIPTPPVLHATAHAGRATIAIVTARQAQPRLILWLSSCCPSLLR